MHACEWCGFHESQPVATPGVFLESTLRVPEEDGTLESPAFSNKEKSLSYRNEGTTTRHALSWHPSQCNFYTHTWWIDSFWNLENVACFVTTAVDNVKETEMQETVEYSNTILIPKKAALSARSSHHQSGWLCVHNLLFQSCSGTSSVDLNRIQYPEVTDCSLTYNQMKLTSRCVHMQVTFTNGADVKAKVLGVDEDKDLAVLIIDPKTLGDDVRHASQLHCDTQYSCATRGVTPDRASNSRMHETMHHTVLHRSYMKRMERKRKEVTKGKILARRQRPCKNINVIFSAPRLSKSTMQASLYPVS